MEHFWRENFDIASRKSMDILILHAATYEDDFGTKTTSTFGQSIFMLGLI